MRRWLCALLLACAPVTAAFAADALGLYFSDTVFTLGSATATVEPGFLTPAYIVLTEPTGAVVSGYEVAITCTAPDFTIPLTSLFFDTNAGTNVNEIVTFLVPKPTLPGGTVLATVFIQTNSEMPETISFGPSSPSRLRCGCPVIDYGPEGLVACDWPFGTPVVAWLNGHPIADESAAWGAVKALYR